MAGGIGVRTPQRAEILSDGCPRQLHRLPHRFRGDLRLVSRPEGMAGGGFGGLRGSRGDLGGLEGV